MLCGIVREIFGLSVSHNYLVYIIRVCVHSSDSKMQQNYASYRFHLRNS